MKNSTLVITLYLYIWLLVQNLIVMFIGFYTNNSDFVFIDINSLSIISVILFMIILLLILKKPKLYFLFLPAILIGFPNVINDLFPSFYTGVEQELGRATFSLVTHIDFYLFFGIVLFARGKKNNKPRLSMSLLVYPFITAFYYVNLLIFSVDDFTDLYLLSVGNYFIRYAFLFLMLFSIVKLTYDIKKNIIYGLGLSVFFLFLESLINTHLHHLVRLTSGTLAVNVYANTITGIVLFFIFLKSNFKINKIFKSVVILIGIIIILLTKTKMALATLVIVFNIVFILEIFKKVTSKFVISVLFFYILSLPLLYNYVSTNSTYINFINSVSENGLKQNQDTSSVFTRFLLIDTSLNIINEHPVLGIGSGRWNYYKEEYGFPFHVIIDPHNDYLCYLSTFGLFLGSYFIIILLLIPSYLFLGEKIKRKTFYYLWGIIPFSFMFSGLSNSNTYKHQVTALIFLIFSIIYQNLQEGKKYENSNTRNKGYT